MTSSSIPLLTAPNIKWIRLFNQKYGRKPVILHIGNIANNGYNNAKILNSVGFDCDVLSYDYYHMMGTPEWEDSYFTGDYINDFLPDWYKVKFDDFSRPLWFSQGRLKFALNYLLQKRSSSLNQKVLWEKLLVQSRLKRPSFFDPLEFICFYLHPHINNKFVSYVYYKLSAFSFSIYERTPHLNISDVFHLIITTIKQSCSQLLYLIRYFFLRAYLFFFLKPFESKDSYRRICIDKFDSLKSRTYNRRTPRFSSIYSTFIRFSGELSRIFMSAFPSRKDQLNSSDVLPYLGSIPDFRKLFACYDLVLCYATDPIWPLLCDKPYFAIEHGTLRDIPYAISPLGRLVSLAYNQAQHVFVTNFDCEQSALSLTGNNYTLMNHPYDEYRPVDFIETEKLRCKLLAQLESDFLIFHPTRLDWIVGTGYADKDNIQLINAFIELRHQGYKVGLILCKWGQNYVQAIELLQAANVFQYVKCFDPMPVKKFERFCKACDILADQFKLGAFGGILFKAFCVGTPVLGYIDEDLALKQYPQKLPVLNCRTSEDIVETLQLVLQDPLFLKTLSEQSKEWISQYHSKSLSLNHQIDQFRSFLPLY